MDATQHMMQAAQEQVHPGLDSSEWQACFMQCIPHVRCSTCVTEEAELHCHAHPVSVSLCIQVHADEAPIADTHNADNACHDWSLL
jgi:hypothetical protein